MTSGSLWVAQRFSAAIPAKTHLKNVILSEARRRRAQSKDPYSKKAAPPFSRDCFFILKAGLFGSGSRFLIAVSS